MLRSISTKAFFAVLAGLIFLVALIGIAWEYAQQRTRLREHAATIVQGDPRRGEVDVHPVRLRQLSRAEECPHRDRHGGPAARRSRASRDHCRPLRQHPANMQKWIRDPQQVSPGTAMPDLNVGAGDARDITAFLYTRAR